MVEVHDPLFDENALVLELTHGVIADAAVHGAEQVDIPNLFYPHAPAAGGCLDQHQRPRHSLLNLKIKQGTGDLFRFKFVINGTVRTRHRGDAQTAGQTLGIDLVSQFADDPPRGADEDEGAAAFRHTTGKAEIFGKESVTGMNGRGSGIVGNAEKLVRIMIGRNAIQAFGPAGFSGKAHMAGRRVLRRIDTDKFQSQFPAGLHDPDGYLAPIGDKNLVVIFHEHPFLVFCRPCVHGRRSPRNASELDIQAVNIGRITFN